MFTDIVGFTSLAQADEADTLEKLEEHRSLLRSIYPKHGGREVKTIGDAFLLEFPSALDAVVCSIEMQRSMHDRNLGVSEERRLLMRVGVHVGDVVHSQGDILGDAVNVSSRIEPLAPPGGVCISEQVYDHVRNKVDLPLERLEGKTLKNVKLPIEVYRIVMPWESETKQEAELDTKRVAVLPLRNMSPDPNDEYFADGMTEELITALSTVTELTVIARTSVMQYKGSPKRISDIGKELNAGTMIEGSVRKASNKVRITVQLIDARNEGHLWAQNYDKELNDIFAIQSEVAQKVADSLRVELLESNRQRIERGSTRNTEAYTLYLKALFYMAKRSPQALKTAADLLEQATSLDKNFALGFASLGRTYGIMAANFVEDPVIYYPKSKECALKALSLDDGLAEAHVELGTFAMGHEWDLEKAEAEFREAIRLDPNYAPAHQLNSFILMWEKRYDEAWREINRALELSPLSLIIHSNIADYYYFTKQYEKGIEFAKKALDLDPAFFYVRDSLVKSYVGMGAFDEALRASESYYEATPLVDQKLMRAHVFSAMGRREECLQLIGELEANMEKQRVSPFYIANIYFRLGEMEKGFEWLERAYSMHDRFVYLMAAAPDLDRVREDPRYKAMESKVGLTRLLKDGRPIPG